MTAFEDVPMFEVEQPELRTPKRRKTTDRPRWTRYRPKTPIKCDDCMLVLALADGNAPPARFAHHKRKAGKEDLLLCNAHAQVRREEDGMKPIDIKDTP